MAKPDSCINCPCYKMGTDFTSVEIGARYEQTKLVLIGEASGAGEAREGLPFRPWAQSGSLLSDAMRDVGVSRSEVAITNVLRCRPKNDYLEGAPYQYAAINHCVTTYLIPEIERLQPRAILALGGIAMRVLTEAGRGKAFQLEYIRGFARPGAGCAEGIPVISTFHPSFLRRGAAHLVPLLQRDLLKAFRIATGKVQPVLDPMAIGLRYDIAPSVGEAWEFERQLDPTLPLAFDLETPMSTRADEDERTSGSFTNRDIKLFQATQKRGEGIALPWRDEFVDVIKSILAKCPIKTGFNDWNFDDPVLMANGVDVGETHDAMVMFHAYQPDLPANLQAAAQYCGFEFPWKDKAATDLEWYGIADVDANLCVFQTMSTLLERDGLADFYRRYFHEFWPILRTMSRRGYPVSEPRRLALKSELEAEGERIDAEVKALVPRDVLTVKQKKGLKRLPKDMAGMKEIEVVIEKEEKCVCVKKNRPSCELCLGTGMLSPGLIVKRWAAEVEFNPNSSHQVKAFIRYLGHPMPKHGKRVDAQGEASETTEVKELERLHTKTGHKLYPLLIEKRQVSKLIGTYVEGWKPEKDGRVRTTFTFKPATLQLSSRAPNIQNGLKHASHGSLKERMAKSFNAMQCAEDGHVMMNFDLKSFHAQTLACEAGDADYLRLAKIDVHSFVTCHFIKHPDRVGLLKMSDADLSAFFKSLKKDKEFKFIRDYKAKRAILGLGFGLGARKLYQMNAEDFANEAEAKKLLLLIMEELFPKLKRYQTTIKAKAAEEGILQNKYGAIRRFYDVQRWDRNQQKWVAGDQAEQAVAFLPASSAFGHVRDIMHRLRAKGLDERYQLVNSIHDSLVFHCPRELVEECGQNVVAEMSAPSSVLKYSICPGGLSVESEASLGPDLANMEEWQG